MSDRSILSFNIEEDLKKVKTIKDLVGRDGILKPMVKEMSEQLLEAEMSEYLGYEK